MVPGDPTPVQMGRRGCPTHTPLLTMSKPSLEEHMGHGPWQRGCGKGRSGRDGHEGRVAPLKDTTMFSTLVRAHVCIDSAPRAVGAANWFPQNSGPTTDRAIYWAIDGRVTHESARCGSKAAPRTGRSVRVDCIAAYAIVIAPRWHPASVSKLTRPAVKAYGVGASCQVASFRQRQPKLAS